MSTMKSLISITAVNHPSQLWLVSILYGLRQFYLWFTTDYQAFLDLGKGGTPTNLWGWWRIKRLSLFRVPSVFEAPHVPPYLEPYRGMLENMPIRSGVRPAVGGMAPQRQINQRAGRSMFNTLKTIIKDFAAAHPEEVYVEKSFLEGHTVCLRGRPTALSNLRPETKVFGYEICHPHLSDGSVHLIMHPEDVKTVIESGWGERHPLARADWWWLLYFKWRGVRPPIPETLVFAYAPRDAKEVQVMKELIRAAAWWITGVELGEPELEEDVVPGTDDAGSLNVGLKAGLP